MSWSVAISALNDDASYTKPTQTNDDIFLPHLLTFVHTPGSLWMLSEYQGYTLLLGFLKMRKISQIKWSISAMTFFNVTEHNGRAGVREMHRVLLGSVMNNGNSLTDIAGEGYKQCIYKIRRKCVSMRLTFNKPCLVSNSMIQTISIITNYMPAASSIH